MPLNAYATATKKKPTTITRLPAFNTTAKTTLTPRPGAGAFGGGPGQVPQASAATTPIRQPSVAPPVYQGSTVMQNAAAMGQGTQSPSYLAGTQNMPMSSAADATAQNAGSNLTSQLTGLAGSFDPALLQYIYAQPELILKQLMQNQGQSPLTGNSGLFAAGTPYMDALMSILPLAFGGQGQPNPSSAINWMGDQMQQGLTPGGQGIDFGNVMRALQGQLGDTSSATAQYYNAPNMDPLDQINKAKEIIFGAGSMGLAPQFQTALKNMMNTAGLNYTSNFAQGRQAGNFLPWLLKSSYMDGYK